MDLGRAFRFSFEDKDWPVKALIGTLLSLIPFVAQGYQLSVARNVMQNRARPLPDRNEIGEVIMNGIVATVAWVLYALPLLLIVCVFMFPVLLLNDTGFDLVLGCVVVPCLLIFGLLYALPAMGMYWMGVIRYSQTGKFSEFTQIASLWGDMRQYFSILVLLLVYMVGLSLATAVLAPFLSVTCIGAPILLFAYMVISGHLIGQAGMMIAQEEA